MRTFSALLAIGIPLLITPALAADWKVGRVAGQGWIVSEGSTAVPARAGVLIPVGSTFATGPNGRATLVHGQDTVLLGPGTKVAIPHKPDRGLTATLIQQVGSVKLSIEKLAKPHFSVQTPLLVAVVKGTEFTVTVSGASAGVSVSRGLVSVADRRTGQKSDLGPGQSAMASSAAKGLQVSGLAPAAVQAGAGQTSKSGAISAWSVNASDKSVSQAVINPPKLSTPTPIDDLGGDGVGLDLDHHDNNGKKGLKGKLKVKIKIKAK